jgi:hypothetical protein
MPLVRERKGPESSSLGGSDASTLDSKDQVRGQKAPTERPPS